MKVLKRLCAFLLGTSLVTGGFVALSSKKADQAEAVEAVYAEAIFIAANQPENSSYTGTFENTTNGFTWTLANFNNNKNGWSGVVKCGRKDVASVGTISTKTAVSETITKVSINITALTASKVNSIKLYGGSDGTSQLGSFAASKGTKEVSIAAGDQAANQIYKIEFDCAAGSGNGLVSIDSVKLYYEASSATPLESISCSNQSINVVESVDLASELTFTPNTATNKNVSYSITSGSDCIDLTNGVVKGKKGGSAVVTITPEDTTGGATAINVNISVSSISVPAISVGDQYVIYAIDETNSFNGELTGVASNLGTVGSFSGSVPSCSHVFDIEEGYFENTVAFKNGSTYLSLNSSANNLYTKNTIDANSSWVVSVDGSTGIATIQNGAYPTRSIQFNYSNGNPRFACYASVQVGVRLFQYTEETLENFVFDDTEMSVYISESKAVSVTYTPASASDKELNWSSSNDGVATVDNDGVVTGVAVGEAIITAQKTISGVSVSHTITVNVLNNVASHHGTLADPFNIADAVQVARGIFTKDPDGNTISLENQYYARGMVTATVTRTTSKVTLWLGDNASQTGKDNGGFEIYQCETIYGTAIATYYEGKTGTDVTNDFPVGSIVLVKSTFTEYNGTPETTNKAADIVWSDMIEARKFAESFNSAFSAVCDADGNSDVNDLADAWSLQKTAFEALEESSQNYLKAAEAKTTSAATPLELFAAKYEYIGGKYNTQLGSEFDFLDRNPTPVSGSPYVVSSFNNSNSSTIIIVVVALTSITSIGVLLVIKRKRSLVK